MYQTLTAVLIPPRMQVAGSVTHMAALLVATRPRSRWLCAESCTEARPDGRRPLLDLLLFLIRLCHIWYRLCVR